MKVMILAAGRGKRLRPLTDAKPKPLVAVGGEALIVRHIKSLARFGLDDILINIAWLSEQIVAALGDGKRFGVSISYSDEGEALETGGGIYRALKWLGSQPFLVVNGDILTDYEFSRLPSEPQALAHLVLVPKPAEKAAGDFSLRDGLVSNCDPGLTFSGIGVYRPELFADCESESFPLAPLLRRWVDKSRVSGELHPGRWHDVGTVDRLEALNQELLQA
ncbi:MAG: N-acetylmuramate alpha-1-phosphate uridylyltransferase MurU [Pseudomonadota bacterium]